MKTQITLETTPDQEMIIGLIETGHFTRAKRVDIASYFEGHCAIAQEALQTEVERLMKAVQTDEVAS